jgi:hypothetical protein
MSIPLQNARLCLDCDTVFDEQRCPSCSSESYFPLSRWVRPAMASEKIVVRKKANKASMVLLGTGAAYALWKLLGKPDHKGAAPGDGAEAAPDASQDIGIEETRQTRVRRRRQGGGPDIED